MRSYLLPPLLLLALHLLPPLLLALDALLLPPLPLGWLPAGSLLLPPRFQKLLLLRLRQPFYDAAWGEKNLHELNKFYLENETNPCSYMSKLLPGKNLNHRPDYLETSRCSNHRL